MIGSKILTIIKCGDLPRKGILSQNHFGQDKVELHLLDTIAAMEALLTTEVLLSLLALTAPEVILGIDNIIFISILASKLPESERDKARKLGLLGALVSRLMLLATIAWIVKLTAPLFSAFGFDFSGKSLILLIGGLFLIYKATREIHEKIEGDPSEETVGKKAVSKLSGVIVQIMLLDLVFSLDSVITAVGMSQHLSVMIAANIIALAIMLVASKGISDFVHRHPTIKVLALSFLLMIGLVLVAEGFGLHIPKGYIYFAMSFSVFVELINLRAAGKAKKSLKK